MRGYPVQLVETNLERVVALTSENLLKPKPIDPINAVPTVPTKPKFKPVFNCYLKPTQPCKWLRENYHILEADTKMKKIFPRPPSVVFRQPQT
jgi:hypothetical protein